MQTSNTVSNTVSNTKEALKRFLSSFNQPVYFLKRRKKKPPKTEKTKNKPRTTHHLQNITLGAPFLTQDVKLLKMTVTSLRE